MQQVCPWENTHKGTVHNKFWWIIRQVCPWKNTHKGTAHNKFWWIVWQVCSWENAHKGTVHIDYWWIVWQVCPWENVCKGIVHSKFWRIVRQVCPVPMEKCLQRDCAQQILMNSMAGLSMGKAYFCFALLLWTFRLLFIENNYYCSKSESHCHFKQSTFWANWYWM